MLAQLTLLIATTAPLLEELAHQSHTEVSSAADRKRKSPFAERPLLFETQLGIAMPTGTIGGVIDYSVFPALSLAAGAGTNLVGFEGALELRVRAEVKLGHALTLAGGYSFGPHTQTRANQFGFLSLFLGPMTAMGEPQFPSDYHWDLAHWTNISVGYERRKPSGFNFRVFGGPAFLMNPDDGQPSDTVNTQQLRKFERVSMMIFAGVGLGYSL